LFVVVVVYFWGAGGGAWLLTNRKQMTERKLLQEVLAPCVSNTFLVPNMPFSPPPQTSRTINKTMDALGSVMKTGTS